MTLDGSAKLHWSKRFMSTLMSARCFGCYDFLVLNKFQNHAKVRKHQIFSGFLKRMITGKALVPKYLWVFGIRLKNEQFAMKNRSVDYRH